MSSFCTCLRTVRRRRGMSQQILADRVHISRSTIAMFETGKRHPTMKMAGSIIKALGVSPSAFFSHAESSEDITVIQEATGVSVQTSHGFTIMGLEKPIVLHETKPFNVSIYVQDGSLCALDGTGDPTVGVRGQMVQINNTKRLEVTPSEGCTYNLIMERLL